MILSTSIVVGDVGSIADAGPLTLILPLGLLVLVLTWGWVRTRSR